MLLNRIMETLISTSISVIETLVIKCFVDIDDIAYVLLHED